MTGHVRATLYGVGFNIILILIPVLGMNGSAIATGTGFIVFNIFQWYRVRSFIGLRPSVLGF